MDQRNPSQVWRVNYANSNILWHFLTDCNYLAHVIVLWASLANAKIFVSLSIFLCFILNLRAIFDYNPPGACIWRSDLSESFMFRILRYFIGISYHKSVLELINNQILIYWGTKRRAWKDQNHTFQSPFPLNLFQFRFSVSRSIMFDATSGSTKFLKSLFYFFYGRAGGRTNPNA